MATVFSDNFNRGNGDITVEANWDSTNASAWSIASNQLSAGSGGALKRLITTTSAHAAIADCKVSVTRRLGASFDAGVSVRDNGADVGSETCYFLNVYGSNTIEVYRRVSGAETLIGSITQAHADGDTYALEASGTGATVTLKVYRNGGVLNTFSDTNGSRITAAGRCGVITFHGGDLFDDFLVEDLAGGGATANVTGVSGSGAVGTVSATGAASVALTGVAATGQVGTLTASSGSVNVSINGVSATGQIGTLQASTGTVNAAVTGVAGTGQVGTLLAKNGSTVTLTGVSATGFAAALTPPVHATVELEGVGASGVVGALSLAIQKPLTGVSATGLVGSLSASSGTVTVSLVGVQATGGIGSFAVSASASLLLTGVQGAGAVGTLLALTGAIQALTGVSATGAAGTVAIHANSLITPMGVASTGAAGSVGVSAGSTVSLSGVSAIGTAGSLLATIPGTAGAERRTVRVPRKSRTIRL